VDESEEAWRRSKTTGKMVANRVVMGHRIANSNNSEIHQWHRAEMAERQALMR
jgi:hypothetical protein